MKSLVGMIFLVDASLLIASATPCVAETQRATPGSPWSVEASISAVLPYPYSVSGSLPNRNPGNGSFVIGMRGETPAIGVAVGYSLPAYFSSRLEVVSWAAQLGGEAFLGPPDSFSIGEFDICRASSRSVLLSIRLHEGPDLFYEDNGKKINICGGPALGVAWLDPVSPNAAGAAEMGLTSIRGEPGLLYGGVLEVAGRFGRSRWESGLAMAFLGGGATLKVETSGSSRWQDGKARVRLVSVGVFLSYRLP